MTILQCVNEIEELIRIHGLTSDNKLSRRLILQFMNNQRSLWLKNELNKGRSIEDNIRQPIDGLKLKAVNGSTFIDDPSSYNIFRTELRIPTLVELSHDYNVLFIRTSGIKETKLSYVHRDRIPYVGHTRFSKNKPFVTIYDGYIWLITNKFSFKYNMIDYLSIEGIFEQPELVYSYKNNSYIYNTGTIGINDVFAEKYPVSQAMWTYIKNAILQTDIQVVINSKLKELELDVKKETIS
jgi:hypothetical protein